MQRHGSLKFTTLWSVGRFAKMTFNSRQKISGHHDSSLLNSGSEYALKSFSYQSSAKIWFVEVYNIVIRKVYENDF